MKASSQDFFKRNIRRIFTEKKSVVDIGGGLRISKNRGNRFDPKMEWVVPLAKKIDYKILDPVDTYNPDIVGDIHKLPFPDNSQEAFICISVLEHVEEPVRGVAEMYRSLKPGGFCFLYVPFLYYYHAEEGYYGDFWRFTKDTIKYMCKDFARVEIQCARGAIETWLKISPFGRIEFILKIARILDRILGKSQSNQTSGYYVFLVK